MRLKIGVTMLVGSLALLASAAPASAEGIDSSDDVISVLNEFAKLILTVGFILISVFLLLSGIMYLTARGDEKKAEDAKKQFKYAVIGAIIIIGVRVIIATIEAIVSQGTLFPS